MSDFDKSKSENLFIRQASEDAVFRVCILTNRKKKRDSDKPI